MKTKVKSLLLTSVDGFDIEGIPQELIVNSPKYNLLYTKLNGVTDTYKINSISYMNNCILKAVVDGKGYRSFKTDRIISMVPE